MNLMFFLTVLSLNVLSYAQTFKDFIVNKIFLPLNRNPDDLNLRQCLNKLVIDLPDDLIKNKTRGYLEDITIYNISLESLITSKKKIIGKKMGVEITFRKAGFNIKGKHSVLTKNPKNFLAMISSLNIKIPVFLVKNESGLITGVDTTGFTIDLDHAQIELDLEDVNDVFRNIIVGIIKILLNFIKADAIEKTLIKVMNEELEKALSVVNHIILNGMKPDKLNITINKADLANIKNSSIIGSLAALVNSIVGTEGPFTINSIVNLLTNNTGTISLKSLYNKDIQFDFNITDKNNNSLGNFELSVDDLNASGLNTFRDFNALYLYDPLQILSYANLDNLTLDAIFSLRVKLYNTSQIVRNETIFYQKTQLKTTIQNNELKNYFQLPYNNNKFFAYSNKECLNANCALALIDANGTGINSLSLNETFTYIRLEPKEGDDLDEDLDEAISRLADLFITGFDNGIGILINTLINATLVNPVNKKLNEYLSTVTCPGIEDPDSREIDIVQTSTAIGVCVGIFLLLILSPYILCKTSKKKKEERIIGENDTPIEPMILSNDNRDERDAEAKYYIENISIKWMKELSRIDPEGTSLFLDQRIPLFFRIFIPLAILLTFALFISSSTATGALEFLIFKAERRIQVPYLVDFSIFKNVNDIWAAGSYALSILIVLFSGIWPYIKLILMLISFCFPASIFSHKNREKLLFLLEATGKFGLFDSYVAIIMILAYHILVDVPVVPQSLAKDGTTIDIVVYEGYGYIALIAGTLISMFLSHIITNLNRSLKSHPDENKGEKAENWRAIICFAKTKYIGDKHFRIIISVLFVITFALFFTGSFTMGFTYYFSGLVGYSLDIFGIPFERGFSIFQVFFVLPEGYENPTDSAIIFTQILYFLSVWLFPLLYLLVVGGLWFIPLRRREQKILLIIAEILNAWSCYDVFIIALIATVDGIEKFTNLIIDDKCKGINPFIKNYFSGMLKGNDTCYHVKASTNEGCWLYFSMAVFSLILSFVILNACRNALNERLPEHVKEYLKIKNEEKISRVSNINDFSSRTTLVNETLDNNGNNNKNKNLLAEE